MAPLRAQAIKQRQITQQEMQMSVEAECPERLRRLASAPMD